jgi:hypothetical protein
LLALSLHAEKRCRQRGVTGNKIKELIDRADMEAPIGNGCFVISVSKAAAIKMRDGDRFKSIAAIVDAASGRVLTVLHLEQHGRARRYRFALKGTL